MKRYIFSLLSLLTGLTLFVGTGLAQSETVSGTVYCDKNKNGMLDNGEAGIPNVSVSNGREVVQTDGQGQYVLPAYEEMTVFVTKPSGYKPPVNANMVPQFFYIHQPNGSPPEIQQFAGLEPTGDLPNPLNFPLRKSSKEKNSFKAIIMGDTQVYSEREIDYLRDSIVKEVKNQPAECIIAMGDNLGDDLSLYPRYLEVLGSLRKPIYLVPGNHDLNFDAEDDAHSFDTFKRVFGPTYYSFNVGKVHFVVLDSVDYPAPDYSYKTYNGVIDEQQMTWLENDLAFVPDDHLIVLNMHIPIVSFVDGDSTKHQVDNREDLYALLAGRNVVSLGGHTHTLAHFMPGEQLKSWGQPTPIPQIIVGAACGSWWSGDMDDYGIPMAYQRGGAPRGYMVFEFKGNTFQDKFYATGKSRRKQMSLSFMTDTFDDWYAQISAWVNEDPAVRPEAPPVTLHDLPDQHTLPVADLDATQLVINVWNGSRDSIVQCRFDNNGEWITAERNLEIGDPFALRLQSYVLRYAMGFELWNGAAFGPAAPQPLDAWLHATSSTHVWTCDIPENLTPGAHSVKVVTYDMNGNKYSENLAFEVR